MLINIKTPGSIKGTTPRRASAVRLTPSVPWPGNVDLTPDAMYESIKKTGKYIL